MWRRARLLLLIMLFGYGGLIEVLQLFLPGRSCEWSDLFADSAGIVLGAIMAAGAVHMVSDKARPI